MRGLFAACLLTLLSTDAAAFRGQPPSGRAGDPPDGRTCTGCHDEFALNSRDVTLALIDEATGLPLSVYELGIAYDLRFEISSAESGRNRWGFELVPLAGQTQAGQLSAGPSSTLLSGGGREYLAHAPALTDPNGGTWPFAWTAPITDVGEILVWACGNAANGDSDTDGDYIECACFALSPAVGGGGAMTRVTRWSGETAHAATTAFDSVPCTLPSEDLRLCEEAALGQESIDGALPVQLDGGGSLVFIEHDSATSVPGSADLIVVTKDPSLPGGLLVSRR